MNDDEQRFIAEMQEEAHYWFTVSAVVRLSLDQGLAKVLADVIQLHINHICTRKNRKE